GTPTTLTAITEIYQPGAKVVEAPAHPFKYYFDEIQPGMSMTTHKRTITDSDILNFAHLTWDHFYAHTDITALEGSIFQKRAAHGYFVLAAGAGLFVYPNVGPVGANYGLEDCRFIRPVYHHDTLQVRLTCMEKIDRDGGGRSFPAGVVKWYEEILDQDGELVAFATILTLVQKKPPFAQVSRSWLVEKLHQVTDPDRQPDLERMITLLEMGNGTTAATIDADPKAVDGAQTSLYSYRSLPGPLSEWLDVAEEGRFADLEGAKAGLLTAYDAHLTFFKNDSEKTAAAPIFGEMNRYLWKLMLRKVFTQAFGT
ncbi:MAG: MaoC/PaaZ C-terminal domain-containing protein, partial [Chloroflexota bacterium]